MDDICIIADCFNNTAMAPPLKQLQQGDQEHTPEKYLKKTCPQTYKMDNPRYKSEQKPMALYHMQLHTESRKTYHFCGIALGFPFTRLLCIETS
jgi:hypothetical protein